MKVYLASPCGFTDALRPFYDCLKEQLLSERHDVLDPWNDPEVKAAIDAVHRRADPAHRLMLFHGIAVQIGQNNERLIREADCLVAVLDGMEPDSGTCSEVGFAAGLGKRVFGLRLDVRDAGDFPGQHINLQVMHWIRRSGGALCLNQYYLMQELKTAAKTRG